MNKILSKSNNGAMQLQKNKKKAYQDVEPVDKAVQLVERSERTAANKLKEKKTKNDKLTRKICQSTEEQGVSKGFHLLHELIGLLCENLRGSLCVVEEVVDFCDVVFGDLLAAVDSC